MILSTRPRFACRPSFARLVPRSAGEAAPSWLLIAVAAAAMAVGCAKVQPAITTGGGTGGAPAVSTIPNLASITVSPSTQTLTLAQDSTGQIAPQLVSFTAQAMLMDGTTIDATNMVTWTVTPYSAVTRGAVTVIAPGVYNVTAANGPISGTGQIMASFSGNFVGGTFTPAMAPILDGTPSGAPVSIAYPLPGSIFPSSIGAITVHVAKTGAQDIARLSFVGDGLAVNFYAPCDPGPGPGCYVNVPSQVTTLFIATSTNNDIKLTARLASSAGGNLSESSSVNVAWASVPLSGGLYYWTTIQPGSVPGYHLPAQATSGTGIQRYNLDNKTGSAAPELVYTDEGTPPLFYGSPPAQEDGAQCVGCHAITNDGKTMALTVGGSSDSDFALLDIGTKTLTSFNPAAAGGSTSVMDINYYKQFRQAAFSTETTFGPNNDIMVVMFRSQLSLHAVNVSLANQGPVVPSWTEYKADPFWSYTGKYLVFTSFAAPYPAMYNPTGLNGDLKQGGQIVIADANATGVADDARVLVPRQNGVNNYYPVVSPDDALVAYDQSSCGSAGVDVNKLTTDYGNGTCDSYDDSSANLWMVTPAGGAPVRLDHANGASGNDNSWPRWSPNIGTFRGQKLYWLAFSSRRAYGLQVNYGIAPVSTKPQLWIAAVVTGAEFSADPSYAPIWLPNQNTDQAAPSGNHVPQWVSIAVAIQ